MKLGHLSKEKLRDIWQKEDSEFTPWLADNLQILGEEIGAELELEEQEKKVGPFRADILCKNTDDTDHWVLIENQLGRTDHSHLGQLLTYAAGLQAVTVVWVAAEFTDEHRAAIDWLNDITDGRFQFFGLAIELWRIDESPLAPKFNIVCKPNDWTRSVGQSVHRLGDETKKLQLRYWKGLQDFLRQQNSKIRSLHKPKPQHWMAFDIGRDGFHLAATIKIPKRNKQRLGVELYIRGEQAKGYHSLLCESREDIEAELGQKPDWQPPNRKSSRIVCFKPDFDVANESDWPEQYAWIAKMLERFDRVFRPRVKALPHDDTLEDDGQEEE